MLRMVRALLFSYGFLPADGQQHKTVVEITGNILGEKYTLLIKQFERMRKKRNIFFYEAEDAHNLTEAKKAAEVANDLISIVSRQINTLNPQKSMSYVKT